jgi:methionine synthase II (cobalamin-independent)
MRTPHPDRLHIYLRPHANEKLDPSAPHCGIDEAAFEKCLTDSVAEAVRLQAEAGIDVVSDGEYGKSVNCAFYVHQRLSGLTWRPYTAEEAKDPTIAVIDPAPSADVRCESVLLTPYRIAASQLPMEQASFGRAKRVLQAGFKARKQIAERSLGANGG